MAREARALAEHDTVLDHAARADHGAVVERDVSAEHDVVRDRHALADVQSGRARVRAQAHSRTTWESTLGCVTPRRSNTHAPSFASVS